MDAPSRPAWARAWPFAVSGAFAASAVHPLSDIDLFWHLALGRAVLESGARVVPEPLVPPSFGSVCIVHEWAWDVLLYGVHARFGWVGISALVVAVAAIAGFSFGLLVTRWNDEAPPFLTVLAVTLLAAPLVLTRINERPESLAMALWPLGLLAARRLGMASSLASARAPALALMAIALLWSQVHLSLVAFVPAAAIVLLPGLLEGGPTSRLRAGALGAVALSLLATVPGLLIFSVPSRVTPFIAAHVAEWKPLAWALLDPTDPELVQGPAFATLLLLGVVLGWRRRSNLLVEYGLVLLGLFLVAQGRRGATPATLLSVPLAVAVLSRSATRLSFANVRLGSALLVAYGLLLGFRFVQWMDRNVGHFGHVGLEEGAFPVGATRLFSTDSGEHRALTTYRTGPPVGFESRGRIRTFVDSRTPIFTFDDGDLAAAQTTWAEPAALEMATARYGFDLAVVERRFPVCAALVASPDWVPVLVEPGIATFARKGTTLAAERLKRLQPCGDPILTNQDCAEPIAELDAAIERVAVFTSPGFAGYLRAEQRLRCGAGTLDLDAILALLPTRASGFEAARDGLKARLYALAGRPVQAVELLAPHVAAGRTWLLADTLPGLSKGGADGPLRAMLEPLVDEADGGLLAALANTCARLGDARCARLHGVRAAALGRFDAAPALCFARNEAPTREARDDADQWLATMRSHAPEAARAALSCEPTARVVGGARER